MDASVWVSRFVQADAYHERSVTFFLRLIQVQEAIAAPVLVLAEVAGAVARRTRSTEDGVRASALIQRLPNIGLAGVDQGLAALGAELAADLRLRGVDALYVAVAQSLGVPLVTWDLEQKDRAAATVTAVTPAELPFL